MFESYDEFAAAVTWNVGWELLDLLPGSDFNACDVVVDRHCTQAEQRTAMIFRDHQGARRELTFGDIRSSAARVGTVLSSLGVAKGDRVFVLLEPMPELYAAILGAIRIGAIAGPLFSSFGTEAVVDRLHDSGAGTLITAAHHLHKIRGAREKLPNLERVLVLGGDELQAGEVDLSSALAIASAELPCNTAAGDDPMLLHYSSGTTGKPKGVLHGHKAVVAHALTARMVLDLRPGDIYWCTADPGWVTGTSYGIFGPWANGITQVSYVGGFSSDAWYQIIEEERVSVWYTSPTALRLLMRDGVACAAHYDLSSLRHVCSVGEPLNPEVIRWASEAYGLTVHDTWWQTETGCILVANYPFMEARLGSMGRPFAEVTAAVVDPIAYTPLPPQTVGLLAVRPGWPSMFQTYWGREDAYSSKFHNGWYVTEDRAYEDEDGYFWFVGRDDDVINTSGHLVGPFEVESALIRHPFVVEAAAFAAPAQDAGEVVVAEVVLTQGAEASRALVRDLKSIVRRQVGPYAVPREILFVEALPRTRSGKIMRRAIRAQHLGLPVGDLSSLDVAATGDSHEAGNLGGP
jgi:acetyl-CoA synthetase